VTAGHRARHDRPVASVSGLGKRVPVARARRAGEGGHSSMPPPRLLWATAGAIDRFRSIRSAGA